MNIKILIPLFLGLVILAIPFKSKIDHIIKNISFPFIFLTSKASAPYKFANNFWKKVKINNEEIKKLENQIEEQEEKIIKLESMLKLQEFGRELKDFQKRYELENAVLSKALLKNFSNDSQYFYIDKGKRNGVKIDSVATYKLQILGKVTEVYDRYSKITLITDRSSKVSGQTNFGQQDCIVQGKNDPKECFIKHSPVDFNAKEGDYVLTNGQGLVFPEGFCLGKIVLENQTQKTVLVSPLCELDSVEYCHLISN